MRRTSAPFVEQEVRRQGSLVTPDTLSVDIGASSTTLYAVKPDDFFLLRKFIVVNETGGPIDFQLTVDGVIWVPSVSIAAGASVSEEELAGALLDPNSVLAATGQNLRVIAWGVRVFGGDDWVL